MAMFRYEAVDSSGKLYRGAMQAADQNDLANKLRTRGFALRSAFDASGNTVAPNNQAVQQQSASRPWSVIPSGLQAVSIPPGIPISIKSHISPRQMALFLRQLVTMVKSGMPLTQSLRENLLYIRNAKLRMAASQISDKIEAGSRLSDAMAQFPNIFPSHIIGSIVCGELGGDLDIFLNDAAAEYEREARDTIKGKIGWFFAKSSIISGIFGTTVSFRILDPLLEMLKSGNTSQMTFNGVISAIVGQMVRIGLPITLISTAILVATWYIWGAIKQQPQTRYMLDKMRSKIPPWGTLHKNRSIHSFLISLDRLFRAGIDINRAWEASALVCRDNSIAVALTDGNAMPGESIGLTERFSRSGILKVEEIGLINSGERAGKLPETLVNLAESYKAAENPLVIAGTSLSISAALTTMIITSGLPFIAIASSWNDFMQYFLNMGEDSFISWTRFI